MTVYKLDRFNLLLIDDNSFIRHTIEDVLRRFKIDNITTASNGQEAIDYLKSRRGMSRDLGSLGLDLIISDLVMAPINGILLLQWLRTSEESPNRFLPFVMLSGAADAEYVRASRDAGMSEFLAKPFSSESVYKRILEVIDYPRQFVTTTNYFGPDRRRRKGSPPNKERRVITEKDVTIVYSMDKVVKPETETDVWYFRLPNRLQEKAGGSYSSGPGEMPMELLAEAEEQLQRASLDFTDWAKKYLDQLSALCDDALNKPEGRKQDFEKINLLGHELRGQGGTFGYPLITSFAKMLYDATFEGCAEDDNAVEIVKAHIDAMRAVLREKISGDGGEIGRALQSSLEQAIEKYQTKV